MTDSLISVEWLPRDAPLLPRAVVARGSAARALALRLLTREDAALARLDGAVGNDLLLVAGPSDDLPWADGAIYLGADIVAPGLLLPTLSLPSVPPLLLEKNLRGRFPHLSPPIVVIPEFGALLSLESARPIERERLLEWLARYDAGRDAP